MHCKELALEIGRQWQSEGTGFIHFCYHSDSRDTIPIRENFAFILALLRSRIAKNIHEAKGKLEKLLSYQVDGNFPIYLHEYPTCYNRWCAADVLPSLIWIFKGYHHVLGAQLKIRLETAIRKVIEYSLAVQERYTADYLTTLRIGCSMKAAGKLMSEISWIESGEKFIRQVEGLGIQPAWFISEQLGHMLSSLNLDVIWPSIWQHCLDFYHESLSVYCGPHLAEKQCLSIPELTLFNLYLGDYHHTKEMNPSLILGALIHPFEKPEVGDPQVEGTLEGKRWEMVKTKDLACSLLDLSGSVFSVEKCIFSPVNLIWGNAESPHSLVAQGGNFTFSKFRRCGHEVEFMMTLGKEVENDHPKDRVEIAFYCSRADTELSINEKRATLFQLGEKVCIHSSKSALLEFFLEEGEGDFTGHFSVGNRPSQIKDSGEAFDWKIILRSVRRSSLCVIRVKLTIDV